MANARLKRLVTEEWHNFFPEFGVWKPLVLLRRIGPVLQGITLDVADRAGRRYYPVAHIHALTESFPTISLELSCVPGNTMQGRSLYFEKEGRVAENAAELRERCPLPLDEPPQLSQVVTELRRTVESMGRLDGAVPQLVDMVLVAAFGQDPSVLADALAFADEASARWRTAPEGFESPAAWSADLRARASDLDVLSQEVERNIVALKVDKVRSYPY